MPANQTNRSLSDAQANAIAQLLNTRNQLTVHYTRERVLKESTDYILRLSETSDVIACVRVKKVQWYQAEILHLTVAEGYEGRGHAKALLCQAENLARAKGARILQCTIRVGNDASRDLFEGFGFVHTRSFFNQDSGNKVGVFQKDLVDAS